MRDAPPRLCVIGLGKLGSPMAAVFAAKGFDVTGVDLNPAYVDAINAGRAPVAEPRLQACLDAGRSRLRATTRIDEGVAQSDVSFVIVPTPSGPDCSFRNEFVVEAVSRIGHALRATGRAHLVVVTSTVMPGSTGGVIRQALEAGSGRVVGRDVGLCYSPEFIALGSVVRDLLHPDMVLIGESDPASGDRLEQIYTASTESDPVVCRMNFVNAEICKIAVNTFVTTKISYANMLAELCERLEGADVDAISRALGADSRIGHKYLRGGVAYGGPCFPRDNKAFAALARSLGVPCDLAEATDRINEHQVHRLLGAVQAVAGPGACVAVLGMAYKPDTPVAEESQGVALARLLVDEGYRVVIADPLALSHAESLIGRPVETAAGFAEALALADAAVVTTPWPAIREIAPQALARPDGLMPIVDPWGILSGGPLEGVARVLALGRAGRRAGEEAAVSAADLR